MTDTKSKPNVNFVEDDVVYISRHNAPVATEAVVNDFADALDLFLNGFTARDVAEPLPSFDDTATLDTVRDAIHAQQLDVFGIRQSGPPRDATPSTVT
jgi:hypothetical protein